MPDPGSPISRRESLKKAAGALALSLGAPAALAADDSDTALRHWKMSFYKDSLSGDPIGSVELPHDLADKLSEDGLIIVKGIKFDRLDVRSSQSFDVRPAR